jgi:hypothetical protein
MARTLEELDPQLATLRAEVEALKNQEAQRTAALLEFAGCFTGDEDWERLLHTIEERRRRPAEEAAPT